MGFQAAIDSILSIGGWNTTDMNMLIDMEEDPFTHVITKVNLKPNAFVYHRKNGKQTYGFGLRGLLRDDDGSVGSLINDVSSARESFSVICCPYGQNPGATADIFPKMQLTNRGKGEVDEDGFIEYSGIRYELAGEDPWLLDGKLIARIRNANDLDAPYENSRYDNGAVADMTNWNITVHVAINDFDDASRLDVRLYHNNSATPNMDGSGWSLIGQNNTFRFPANAGTRQDAMFSGNTALGRWIGVGTNWTGDSGSPSADILVAFHA